MTAFFQFFSMFCFEKPIFSILSIHTHRLTHCTSTCWFNETYTLTHKIPYNNIQSGGDGVGDGGGDDDDVVVFLRLSMHTRIHARARSCARSRRVSFNELNWRRAREWEYVSEREREGGIVATHLCLSTSMCCYVKCTHLYNFNSNKNGKSTCFVTLTCIYSNLIQTHTHTHVHIWHVVDYTQLYWINNVEQHHTCFA